MPEEFKLNLQNFIVGATLAFQDGKVIIGKNLYKAWLTKIWSKGFGYEIDFKTVIQKTIAANFNNG